MAEADTQHGTARGEQAQWEQALWRQQQQETLLEMAVTIADDEADQPEERRLSQAGKDNLVQRFEQQFGRMLTQQQAPAESRLRSWIRHQLGIRELSYGGDSHSDSDNDSNTDQAAAQPVQAGRVRQQQQQQQQRKEPRRSSRPNIGQMGSSYDAQFGPTMGNSAGAAGRSWGGGRQGTSAQQQMPLTPAAAAHKPRPSRPGRER
jgi:hypothetical protein